MTTTVIALLVGPYLRARFVVLGSDARNEILIGVRLTIRAMESLVSPECSSWGCD